ncbi:SIS domain-containing protein [Stenotrophomonas rhizophila]|uniref:SIS domain-containing protein n=1 Tax=Stenotrophomonas rhizophila TaxID=216778 RepID=UPI001E2DD3C6|nr:SIS domain-containing protein [Stenotrophomonas rhizophila]MCC7634422.1 SIS domain-containing protein [Stenotrophomonas rhizophila]MCC7663820.1 SIS domain-containing protein [Stenotrophomonas rhizophila]
MDASLLSDLPAWQRLGGAHTAEEIAQQPSMWTALADVLDTARARLDAFLGDRLRDPGQLVILTGAGSSGFIAEMVADQINAQWPAEVRAVHTTSLLTHPALYLRGDRPTLLVSFGRSGSSPESVAVVELVRDQVADARFLDITCNAEGELAKRGQGRNDTLSLLMPAASCDRAFAMTSSLSSMLLAALSVFDRAPWPQRVQRLLDLAGHGERALQGWDAAVGGLAQAAYTRVIYLGSGPLEALAREAALKVLELTGGRVLALANTPLGFRHGPKSTLNGDTLVVMLRSAQALSRRYEQDLLDELRGDGIAARVISVGPDGSDRADGDFVLAAPALPDPWLAPLWLLMPQCYALQRSAALGMTPDNPFPDGTVNRVVQGVTIHPHG